MVSATILCSATHYCLAQLPQQVPAPNPFQETPSSFWDKYIKGRPLLSPSPSSNVSGTIMPLTAEPSISSTNQPPSRKVPKRSSSQTSAPQTSTQRNPISQTSQTSHSEPLP
ncbi:uncharacterized protein MYCFIDRAFT_173587 [Pseudocercospora fijiensis CIRAD86]|uniref:Uncharacterized protein n=1 Tax=Pseudocercospora fijiensis (strain CIRAD86) TaxID=383855 RepID=M3B5K8_PSEFD|nr:uncharacterized protein MYCFIDRAFT_173587 [Pseudocercospora fijiensis CIRAD86]EME84638.1 hypothetical protein MYCFIDRAFT_173587 [Pseudocercospora fijiensis CIRAD86]